MHGDGAASAQQIRDERTVERSGRDLACCNFNRARELRSEDTGVSIRARGGALHNAKGTGVGRARAEGAARKGEIPECACGVNAVERVRGKRELSEGVALDAGSVAGCLLARRLFSLHGRSAPGAGAPCWWCRVSCRRRGGPPGDRLSRKSGSRGGS